jgi:hypothetical protein
VTSGLKFWKSTGFLSCANVPTICILKPELFQSESALSCLNCPIADFAFIVNTCNRFDTNLPFALAVCASFLSRHSFSFPSTKRASLFGVIQYVTNTKSVVSFLLEAQTGGASVPREEKETDYHKVNRLHMPQYQPRLWLT